MSLHDSKVGWYSRVTILSAIEPHQDSQRVDYCYLTVARFFASLFVLFSHVGHGVSQSVLNQMGVFNALFRLDGAIAVEFFFILSGFILARLYVQPIDRPRFYLKRVVRLYPTYLIVMLPTVAIYLWTQSRLGGIHLENLMTSALVLTMLQGWIPSTVYAINAPAWSLSCEALFYTIFPFIRSRSRKVNVISIVFCLFLLQFGHDWITWGLDFFDLKKGLSDQALAGVYASPWARVPQFWLGVLIAEFSVSRKVSQWMALGGTAATLFLLFSGNHWFSFVACATMVLGFAQNFVGSKGRLINGLEVLGHASYSLYLFHVPLSAQLQRSFPKTTAPNVVIHVAVCICTSIVYYLYIEKPLLRHINKRFKAALK